MAASRLLLPMQAAMKLPGVAQGWRCATKIAPSLIPGAGNGRFSGEDIAAGSIVSVKPIQTMAALESLHSVAPDRTLSFSSTGECLLSSSQSAARELAQDLWGRFPHNGAIPLEIYQD